MKIAVLGCGSIGNRHIANLKRLGVNVIAWNRSEERAVATQAKHQIKVYRNKEELFLNEKPDACFVCTPNSFHLADAIEAGMRDCHLFIEKPISSSLEGLNQLEEIINKKNLIVQVGANLRYDFGVKSVYEYYKSGAIGKVRWAHFHGGMYLPDWHPEEDYRQMYSAKRNLGGGVVLDFIHEIDLILWFFGQYNSINGRSYSSGMLEIETDDVADILFYYKNLNVNLHIDYLQKPFTRGIKLIGDKGWCEWSLLEKKVSYYNQKENLLKEAHYPKNYDKNDMYLKQSEEFLNSLQYRKKPDSSSNCGIAALKAALSIKSEVL